MKPAMFWCYNNVVEKDPAKRAFDTVSPYPHRPILALVNWPIGMKEVNPAECMPKVAVDNTMQCYSFRNQWTGTEDDIVVNLTAAARDTHAAMVWGKGERRNLLPCPKGRATHFQAVEDGSGTITIRGLAIGIDFSKASGADGLIAAAGGLKGAPAGMKAYTVGANKIYVMTLGNAPEPQAVGDKLVIGKQEIACDGQKIAFAKMAGPTKLARFGCW